MTLMGTWITGYWDGNGLKAGEDYDVFPFPIIDSKIPPGHVCFHRFLGDSGSSKEP